MQFTPFSVCNKTSALIIIAAVRNTDLNSAKNTTIKQIDALKNKMAAVTK